MQLLFLIFITFVLFISVSSSGKIKKSVKEKWDDSEVKRALRELEESGR